MIVLYWILAVIAVEALVEIIVSADITISIRTYLNRINPSLLGKLFSCGYCMSVWVSILVGLTLPGEINLLIKILVLHRLSNIAHELFSRWFHRLPEQSIHTFIIEDNSEIDASLSTSFTPVPATPISTQVPTQDISLTNGPEEAGD